MYTTSIFYAVDKNGRLGRKALYRSSDYAGDLVVTEGIVGMIPRDKFDFKQINAQSDIQVPVSEIAKDLPFVKDFDIMTDTREFYEYYSN